MNYDTIRRYVDDRLADEQHHCMVGDDVVRIDEAKAIAMQAAEMAANVARNRLLHGRRLDIACHLAGQLLIGGYARNDVAAEAMLIIDEVEALLNGGES